MCITVSYKLWEKIRRYEELCVALGELENIKEPSDEELQKLSDLDDQVKAYPNLAFMQLKKEFNKNASALDDFEHFIPTPRKKKHR